MCNDNVYVYGNGNGNGSTVMKWVVMNECNLISPNVDYW